MAANDDVYISRNIVRSILTERWPAKCASREKAPLWVESVLDAGTCAVLEMKSNGPGKTKSKIVPLPQNAGWTMATWQL